jgi:DNA-binding winged helix-turn-helix (wHTH) protein
MATREIYNFREFTLDVGERRLSRGEVPVHLPPKAHDLLVMLVQHPGRLLTKDELLAFIWPDAFVEEGILTVHVSAVRKALGDDTRPPTYIETVSGWGYRFIASVTPVSADAKPDAAREAMRPLEVYELVGRGRLHLMSGSYFELPHAVSNFHAAIEIDPTYAPAHAGLALTCCAQAGLRSVPHREAYAQAKTSALRALALDDACADAQVALGTVLFLSEWDWVGAEKSLRRALQNNSAHPEALLHYGSLTEALGKPHLGLRFKQQALERDPRSPIVLVQIASSYWHQRRYDDAIVWRTGHSKSIRGICWQENSSPAPTGNKETSTVLSRRTSDAPKSSACPSKRWRTCAMCVPRCGTRMTKQDLQAWPAVCSNTCRKGGRGGVGAARDPLRTGGRSRQCFPASGSGH